VYTAYAKSKGWAQDLEGDVTASAAVEERRQALWEKHCQSHVAVVKKYPNAPPVPPKVYIGDLKGGPFDPLIYAVRTLIANDEPHYFDCKIRSRFRDLLELPEAREVLTPLAHRVLIRFIRLGRDDWFRYFLELNPNEEDLQAAMTAKGAYDHGGSFRRRCLEKLEALRKPI
jgi:hypothetical protein